jgi:hypothetical protein
MPATAPAQPTWLAPVTGGLPPTWFKVERSIYDKRSTPQVSTVKAEFQKYISSDISSKETDILQFWEVSFL